MPFWPNRRFFRTVCFFFGLLAMLTACAAFPPKPSDTATVNDRSDSVSIKQSQQSFTERNSTIVTRMGTLELITRMATPAEVPEDSYKKALGVPIYGAGSLALGLLAPPMFASALVVGGVLLIPLGTHIYFSEKRTWDAINSVLSHAAFTGAIDHALQDRLNLVFTDKNPPKLKAEIVIQSFGLLKSTATRQYCLVTTVRLVINREDNELKQEQLQITDFNKSEDAPPPQCAGLVRFAENGARLLQDTLDESAQVLAVMAIDRILKESEK